MCIISSIGIKLECGTPATVPAGTQQQQRHQQRCQKRQLLGLSVAQNTHRQWHRERRDKHPLAQPSVTAISSVAALTFHHGTTIGDEGNFKNAWPGLVFKTTADFFVVTPAEDRIASAFARRFSKGTPAVLTICPVNPKAVLNPPNIHGHISFPENTELRIESVRRITGPEEALKAGDFSSHSSLNGWL